METRSQVAVVGAGYVGLTLGVCMAELGHCVRMYDIDDTKVSSLLAGTVPFHEQGLDALLRTHLAAGNLRVSTEVSESIAGAEFVFLCVPSPAAEDGSVDLRALRGAAETVGPHLAPGAIVINKSTVPVGSTHTVYDLLGRVDVDVASNPEFLREGTALQDFLNPDRVVIGAESSHVRDRIASLYETLGTEFVLTDPASAELIKYVCNAHLAIRLSFINDVAELCEHVGGDLRDVTRAMGLDERIGPHFLQPGPGWGGSCFPKDITALHNIADAAGYDFQLLREVVESNHRQFDRVATRVMRILESAGGKRIAVWGLAFKAGTDDTRSSPAIEVIDRLTAAGVDVVGYDPEAHREEEGVEMAADALVAAVDADLLVVLTEWPEFAKVDPAEVAAVMRVRNVFDTRGVLDLDRWTAAGFRCEAIGRVTN